MTKVEEGKCSYCNGTGEDGTAVDILDYVECPNCEGHGTNWKETEENEETLTKEEIEAILYWYDGYPDPPETDQKLAGKLRAMLERDEPSNNA